MERYIFKIEIDIHIDSNHNVNFLKMNTIVNICQKTLKTWFSVNVCGVAMPKFETNRTILVCLKTITNGVILKVEYHRFYRVLLLLHFESKNKI